MVSLDNTTVFDVFLSHTHADAILVSKLATRLADEHNFHVWLDKWELIPGEHWQQNMAKALDQARTCAICIGKQTPEGWFKEEVERALNRQAKDRSFRVIPVILPEGNPAFVDNFLELRTWVDFSGGLEDPEAFHRLVSGIKGIPPGRGPQSSGASQSSVYLLIREQLSIIQSLYSEQLIDKSLERKYKSKVLDKYF